MKKNDTIETEAQLSVGEQLRKARLASDRDIKDYSRQLHINVEHLHALEENRFETLSGGNTFVKGYIRSYARALELEPEPLEQAYQRLNVFQDKHKPRNFVVDDRVNKTGLIILSALIASVLLALFVIWFLSSGYRSQADSANTPDMDASTQELFQTQENEPPQISLPDTPLESSVDSADTRDETSEDSQVAPVEQEDPATPEGEAAPEDVSGDVKTTEQSTEVSPPPVNEQAPNDSTPRPDETTLGKGPDKIKIVLTQDSWIEVDDAEGAKSLHGLYKAGDSKLVTGKAPFQVFLGNAKGVRLVFNDQAFDITDKIRENQTARFALIKP